MRLLIDAGNTSLKWNLCADDGARLLGQTRALSWRDHDIAAQLDRAWGQLPDIHSVWLSNVAGEELQQVLQGWLQESGLQQDEHLDLHYPRSQAIQLGVRNAYRDADRLGVDRWLALLACHDLMPAQDACIIDCGSAITVDALRRDGQHLGGMILPGPALMLQSLRNRTRVFDQASLELANTAPTNTDSANTVPAQTMSNDASPVLTPEELAQGPVYGQSTMECIRQGISHSGIAFMEHIITLAQRTLDRDCRIIFTGGAAPHYLPHLSSEVLHLPDLVLQGLLLVSGGE